MSMFLNGGDYQQYIFRASVTQFQNPLRAGTELSRFS